MDKKLTGAAAAVVGAFLYGGTQLLDMEERLLSLEEVCFPAEEEEVDEAAEEPQSEEAEEPAPEEPEEPEEEGAPEEE